MELDDMLKSLETPVKKLGLDMTNEIISILESNDKIASGRLIQSIKYEYMADIDDIKLLITSEDYLTYVDKGRRPGKFVPISALKEWASLRGIPESAVWGINMNIFKFGIKPLNFMDGLEKEYSQPNKFGGIIKQYNKIVAEYLRAEFKLIQKNMKR